MYMSHLFGQPNLFVQEYEIGNLIKQEESQSWKT